MHATGAHLYRQKQKGFRSFTASLIAIMMFFMTIGLPQARAEETSDASSCVDFVQGTDGYQYKKVYWLDFSKCNSDIFPDRKLTVKHKIGTATVSFDLTIKTTVTNETGNLHFTAYKPKGTWSALGSENNYTGAGDHKIALGVNDSSTASSQRGNYRFDATINNINTTGLASYGFLSADAEQFNAKGDRFSVGATGATVSQHNSPVNVFTDMAGTVKDDNLQYGPATFTDEHCKGGLTYSTTGVLCSGDRGNPKEVVFIAKYNPANASSQTFTTSFYQDGNNGAPNSIALGFYAATPLKAPVPVKVANPAKLTDAEKTAVKNAVKKANPDLEDNAITVADDGTVTVTGSDKYADGNFTQKQTVSKRMAGMAVKTHPTMSPSPHTQPAATAKAQQKGYLAVTGSQAGRILTLVMILALAGVALLAIGARWGRTR